MTAGRAMARGLGSRSRRRLLGVGWLEADAAREHASSRRKHRDLGSLLGALLRALGGGYGGDVSLALGVGAVASVFLR